MTTQSLYKSYIIEEYQLLEEPFYVPVADEIELFEAAYDEHARRMARLYQNLGKES